MRCATRRLLAAVVTVFSVWGCGPKRVVQYVPESEPTLRVMTYNVNYGLAGDPQTLEAITSSDADVIFLQETTAEWEETIRRAVKGKFAFVAFHECDCGAGGLAVLSRFPFEDRGILQPPRDGWFPAWHVVLDTSLGKVQALNVHLRPPFSDKGSVVVGYFSTKSVRRDEIAAYWEQIDPELPTVVAGDFNENENGRAVSFLRARGLESALPEFAPGESTWRWKTSVGTVGSTLDHVVYDERLEPVDAATVKHGRSDHVPVVVTFVASNSGG